jgi:demethylmenaquinone methyltransferase/2-methoxy-6-polyprenyl-1,4-benzoquinol methylase
MKKASPIKTSVRAPGLSAPMQAGRRAADVQDMFSRIAPAYDLLNHLLSMRIDTQWRKRLVQESALGKGQKVADLCTGTGDVLLDFHRQIPGCAGLGLDFSPAMLAIARRKAAGLPFEWVQGDALKTGLKSGQFQAVTMAFGLRNLLDVPKGLREMKRLASPGGRVLVLELTRPKSLLFKMLYFPYLHFWLPLVGRLVSRDAQAYAYLRDTIEAFYSPEQVVAMMRESGLEQVRAIPLTGSLATLFIGDHAISTRRS